MEQWLRNCSFVVADMDGNGIELTPQGGPVLRIRFTCGYQAESPAKFFCKIFNLSNQTVQRIIDLASKDRPKNTGIAFPTSAKITVKVGYGTDLNTLFTGQIYQMRRGRESNVDSYLDIFAACGDFANTYAPINTTFAAGYSLHDEYKAVCTAANPWGIETTKPPEWMSTEQRAPRGKVMFGMLRDALRQLARTHDFNWSMQDQQLQVLQNVNGTDNKFTMKPGEAIVLNSQTGLIGVPEQTEQGLTGLCLLNPAIRWGTHIIIDNKQIAQLVFQQVPHTGESTSQQGASDASLMTNPDMKQGNIPELSADGEYIVLHAEHYGDTRENDWYSKFVALAKNSVLIPNTGQVPVPPGVIKDAEPAKPDTGAEKPVGAAGGSTDTTTGTGLNPAGLAALATGKGS